MTENKQFIYNKFDIVGNFEENELKLYEIDNNPSNDLDESNLFYVYSNSEANIENIVDKLNTLTEENEQLKRTLSAYSDATRTDTREIKELLEDIEELQKENEQLKNKIDVLEDDNETYHKSLEKLNLYTKRFIPTKCTNEFKDCKTNRYYWLDHEGNFEGCLELLNLLDCENEVLKSENRQLKGRLMLYEEEMRGDVE